MEIKHYGTLHDALAPNVKESRALQTGIYPACPACHACPDTSGIPRVHLGDQLKTQRFHGTQNKLSA